MLSPILTTSGAFVSSLVDRSTSLLTSCLPQVTIENARWDKVLGTPTPQRCPQRPTHRPRPEETRESQSAGKIRMVRTVRIVSKQFLQIECIYIYSLFPENMHSQHAQRSTTRSEYCPSVTMPMLDDISDRSDDETYASSSSSERQELQSGFYRITTVNGIPLGRGRLSEYDPSLVVTLPRHAPAPKVCHLHPNMLASSHVIKVVHTETPVRPLCGEH